MNLHQLIIGIVDGPEDVFAGNSHDAILQMIGAAIGRALIDGKLPAISDSDQAWELSWQAAHTASEYLDNDPDEVTTQDIDRDADVIRLAVGEVLINETLATMRQLINEQLPAVSERLLVAGADPNTQPARGALGAIACMRQAARQAEMSPVKLVEVRREAEALAS